MDSPPASPRSPTPPPPPRPEEPEQPSGAERRYPLRSTRADNRAASGSSHAASARRYPVRSTRAPSSTPGQRGRALELAPPPAPLSAAPAPAPSSPARARAPAPPSPARARARAPPSPAPLPSSSPSPTSAAASQPPTSVEPTAATSSKSRMDELGSTGGTQEDAKFIKIDMEEMHTVLDTLGVSNDERRSITNDVLRKCLAVYKQALGSLTDRCMPMVKSISALQAQCDDLCRVLGENYALTEEQKRSESLPKIQALLTTVVLSFDEVKKERLNNLQALQLKMIDLWDSLGVTIKDQKEYRYMMCHTCVSVDEVRETNALSTSLLSEIQSEVKRLEGQLMQEVVKKLAVLGSNLRQTHLSGDDDYKLNFSPIDVQEGKIDMLTAHEKVKELIVKSKRDIVQRAENINSAEVVFRKRKENSSHYEAEMSDLVKIRFFYGPGRVQICDTGADLSEFDSIDVDLTAPETWSLSQVKDWLAGSLGLDSQTQTVSVHAWWSHSRTNIYFVLRPLECDSDWVGWLKGCAKRNCSPCALVLPALKEVGAPEDEFSAHEGEGAYDPGQGSEEMNISMSNYWSEDTEEAMAITRLRSDTRHQDLDQGGG